MFKSLFNSAISHLNSYSGKRPFPRTQGLITRKCISSFPRPALQGTWRPQHGPSKLSFLSGDNTFFFLDREIASLCPDLRWGCPSRATAELSTFSGSAQIWADLGAPRSLPGSDYVAQPFFVVSDRATIRSEFDIWALPETPQNAKLVTGSTVTRFAHTLELMERSSAHNGLWFPLCNTWAI